MEIVTAALSDLPEPRADWNVNELARAAVSHVEEDHQHRVSKTERGLKSTAKLRDLPCAGLALTHSNSNGGMLLETRLNSTA
jgi:hypothetical protein